MKHDHELSHRITNRRAFTFFAAPRLDAAVGFFSAGTFLPARTFLGSAFLAAGFLTALVAGSFAFAAGFFAVADFAIAGFFTILGFAAAVLVALGFAALVVALAVAGLVVFAAAGLFYKWGAT